MGWRSSLSRIMTSMASDDGLDEHGGAADNSASNGEAVGKSATSGGGGERKRKVRQYFQPANVSFLSVAC